MKVVYVAGPFTGPTAWDIEQNVRRAEDWSLRVAHLGAVPLCPHANSRFFHGQCTAEFWYDATLELLKRCDAALFLPGWPQSRGCIAEHSWCRANDRPRFEVEQVTNGELRRWIEREAETER